MDRTGVGTVCVWIWAVVFVVHGQNYVNVATGKTYRQSSKWYSSDLSSRGANEDTSGYYPTNCIHTAGNGDLNPLWEVDLGQPYPVYNIDLWARTGLKGRLYPSVITVDNETCAEVATFPSGTRELTVTCSAIMKGRTVRITRRGSLQETNYARLLNMCEMEIYVCTDGWYGQQCSTRCSPGCLNTACDRQSAQCSPCNTGYTGTRCAECADIYYKTNNGTCTSCSSNCLNPLCDKTSGRCNGCVTGRYGDQCSTPCPTGCVNACDQRSAKCASCKNGWYGDQCSTRCSSGCEGNVCQRSGECSPCKDGWYGGLCSVACPSGCLNACDQQSGKCSSCKDGWYGDQCTISCTNGCLRACDQQSAKCASCKDGLHGDQCSTPCPTGCLNDRCLQSGLCSSCKAGYTGSTCSECQDGYYTNSTVCSQCSSNCQSGMCNKTTGMCKGCVEGRYGDTCSSECQTANCQQCDQKTGAVCTQCTLFRQPPACTGCLDNYYRRSDNSRCIRCTLSCKSGTVCDKFTGFCPRCPPSKQGLYCQDEVINGGISTNALIGSVIGGALILGICIILAVIILKRRSARPEETCQNNQASNDLNLSPTSPRPEAPGDREERTTVFQGQEPTYEIAEDRAKATNQQSEADCANPYDLPTMPTYDHNTGDVHLYGH